MDKQIIKETPQSPFCYSFKEATTTTDVDI